MNTHTHMDSISSMGAVEFKFKCTHASTRGYCNKFSKQQKQHEKDIKRHPMQETAYEQCV